MGEVLRALFTGWQAEPVPLVLAGAGVILYVAGTRSLEARGSRAPTRVQRWCLALGVIAVLVALLSPLDGLALRLQWVHMVQHLLLLLVGPPLVVLARPLVVGTAALPASAEMFGRALRGIRLQPAHGGWAAAAVVAVFIGVLWLWHVPALYDTTLRDQFVHDMEHTTFFAVGLLFWSMALPRSAGARSLGMLGRGVIVLAGMIGSWLLAVYIGYAPGVLYDYSGLGSLSAATDQQLAAGVMWVPGSVPFVVVLVVLVARWFELDARAAAAAAAAGGRG